MATTCLMCGSDLEESGAEARPPGETGLPRRARPMWARALAVVGMTLVMLAAVVLGLRSLMGMGRRAESAPVAPTRQPSPTATRPPTPVASPTPYVSPTPAPPRSHQVRQGETLSEIAVEHEVAVADILALNPDVDPELIQVGQVLLIPPDAAGQGAGELGLSDDPDATRADFVVHIVRPGEALLSIAETYGVSVQAIRQANDLGPYEDTIQVNQSLVIPLSAPSPTPSPTADVNATPTPRPPYAAPSLLSPANGEVMEGVSGHVVLQWASVGILEDDEWYAASLAQPSGGVVSATHYTRVTSWRVPYELLIASNARDVEYLWWVQVVEERSGGGDRPVYVEAGAASDERSFIWLAPAATASPIAAATP